MIKSKTPFHHHSGGRLVVLDVACPTIVTNVDRSGLQELSKYVGAHLPLDDLCGTLRSPFDSFDSSRQNFLNDTSDVITKALVCLRDFFFNFFTFLSILSLHKL
jgi:hypothetical protein